MATPMAPLPASRPVRLDIPDVRIHVILAESGVSDPADVHWAAWYWPGPAPGQSGAAVIAGHADSRHAAARTAAFANLGSTRPGDEVDVTRADRTVAEFIVDSVETMARNAFPTDKVYGHTDYPALRLITCGGSCTATNDYEHNVVVHAHLAGSRRVG